MVPRIDRYMFGVLCSEVNTMAEYCCGLVRFGWSYSFSEENRAKN
jgi:hypothetical protein